MEGGNSRYKDPVPDLGAANRPVLGYRGSKREISERGGKLKGDIFFFFEANDIQAWESLKLSS